VVKVALSTKAPAFNPAGRLPSNRIDVNWLPSKAPKPIVVTFSGIVTELKLLNKKELPLMSVMLSGIVTEFMFEDEKPAAGRFTISVIGVVPSISFTEGIETEEGQAATHPVTVFAGP